jgi:hypothetical protein
MTQLLITLDPLVQRRLWLSKCGLVACSGVDASAASVVTSKVCRTAQTDRIQDLGVLHAPLASDLSWPPGLVGQLKSCTPSNVIVLSQQVRLAACQNVYMTAL